MQIVRNSVSLRADVSYVFLTDTDNMHPMQIWKISSAFLSSCQKNCSFAAKVSNFSL